jgi:hypothetical protein
MAMLKLGLHVGAASLLIGLCAAQQGPLISIDKVMTTQEMQAAGINTLSASQRAALDRWLVDYTLRIVKLSQSPSTAVAASPQQTRPPEALTYIGIGKGHWIQTTASNGAILTLEDGSIWDINSTDRIDTALWLPITDITVLRAPSPRGEYKYLLLNTEDGEKALARYLGR